MATERLTKDALLLTLARLAALAAAYADASDEQLAADPRLHAALRSAETILAEHVRERVAGHDARAVDGAGRVLRGVYTRVLANAAGESSPDGPSSRRTWHEGAWYTDEQRRAVLERAFERWLPGLSPADVASADLTAAELRERGGTAPAADEMATKLASIVKRAGVIASVASTFPDDDGSPRALTLDRLRAFVEEALAHGTRS